MSKLETAWADLNWVLSQARLKDTPSTWVEEAQEAARQFGLAVLEQATAVDEGICCGGDGDCCSPGWERLRAELEALGRTEAPP